MVMSTPLRRMVPEVMVKGLIPMMAQSRVDFPDPLGPMRMWHSPGLMVRLIS